MGDSLEFIIYNQEEFYFHENIQKTQKPRPTNRFFLLHRNAPLQRRFIIQNIHRRHYISRHHHHHHRRIRQHDTQHPRPLFYLYLHRSHQKSRPALIHHPHQRWFTLPLCCWDLAPQPLRYKEILRCDFAKLVLVEWKSHQCYQCATRNLHQTILQKLCLDSEQFWWTRDWKMAMPSPEHNNVNLWQILIKKVLWIRNRGLSLQ